MSIDHQTAKPEIDQIIADEFGVNASYVAGLLQQFEENPQSVDEEWRDFFQELLGSADAGRHLQVAAEQHLPVAAEQREPAQSEQDSREPLPPAPAPVQQPPEAQPTRVPEDAKIQLKGPALRIAQNMAASLAVPTATSFRQVPIKLLEENRLLINKHLASRGRKISYTHVVSRAIVKALGDFPQ